MATLKNSASRLKFGGLGVYCNSLQNVSLGKKREEASGLAFYCMDAPQPLSPGEAFAARLNVTGCDRGGVQRDVSG